MCSTGIATITAIARSRPSANGAGASNTSPPIAPSASWASASSAAMQKKLGALGFNVAGFSRRPKNLPGVQSFTDLQAMLRITDAVVCLLPLTPETRGILNGRNLGLIKEHGCLINLARGPQVVM